MYTYMGTKTLSIMDDVYDMLVAIKAPKESFSDEIRKLVKKKADIMNFAGIWKDVTDEDIKKIKSSILESRKNTSRLNDIKSRMQ